MDYAILLREKKLAVAGISNFYNTVPNYSWSVKVITHEFGHLLGSEHKIVYKNSKNKRYNYVQILVPRTLI